MASGYDGQTANQLKTTANTCRNYQSRVSELSDQGYDSHVAGQSGDICNNSSQANPQSLGGLGGMNPMSGSSDRGAAGADSNQNSNDPYGCQANPSSAACQQCSSDPSSPACQALAAQAQSGGQADFSGGDSSTGRNNKNQFNVANESSFGGGAEAFTGADPGAIGTPAKNGTIANNAGGGIPGSGGSGSPASLGGRGGGSGGGGAADSPADILQGFSGGGGYSSPAGGGSGLDDGSGDGERGRRGFGANAGLRGPASTKSGEDLRRFLPGGSLDPSRRIGGYKFLGGQINSKFVNMFERISERMQEKCKLGHLLGCEK